MTEESNKQSSVGSAARSSPSRASNGHGHAAHSSPANGQNFTNRSERGERSVQSSGSSGSTGNSSEQVTKSISTAKLEPIGVSVETNIDKAMKILKRKLIKEGLFKELKTRRYFEKPSEKKKRKMKETMKKLRKEEARARKNNLMS